MKFLLLVLFSLFNTFTLAGEGVPSLDASGKLLSAQLPASVSSPKYMAFTCSSSSAISVETFDGTPTISNSGDGNCLITLPLSNFSDTTKIHCTPVIDAFPAGTIDISTSVTSVYNITVRCMRYDISAPFEPVTMVTIGCGAWNGRMACSQL